VLVDGQVTETGTYKDLVERQGAFAEVLRTFASEQGEEVEDELEIHEGTYSTVIISNSKNHTRINCIFRSE
jgi:hypothetical protein